MDPNEAQSTTLLGEHYFCSFLNIKGLDSQSYKPIPKTMVAFIYSVNMCEFLEKIA
jgi:hypothetical protein